MTSKRLQVVVSSDTDESLTKLVLAECARRGSIVTTSQYLREVIEQHIEHEHERQRSGESR